MGPATLIASIQIARNRNLVRDHFARVLGNSEGRRFALDQGSGTDIFEADGERGVIKERRRYGHSLDGPCGESSGFADRIQGPGNDVRRLRIRTNRGGVRIEAGDHAVVERDARRRFGRRDVEARFDGGDAPCEEVLRITRIIGDDGVVVHTTVDHVVVDVIVAQAGVVAHVIMDAGRRFDLFAKLERMRADQAVQFIILRDGDFVPRRSQRVGDVFRIAEAWVRGLDHTVPFEIEAVNRVVGELGDAVPLQNHASIIRNSRKRGLKRWPREAVIGIVNALCDLSVTEHFALIGSENHCRGEALGLIGNQAERT